MQRKYQHSTDKSLLRGHVPVIGLEVHAQMYTRAKLFSEAPANIHQTDATNVALDRMSQPNEHVALLDAAIPGTLPTLNENCVKQAVATGLALGGDIQLESRFDRKVFIHLSIYLYTYMHASDGLDWDWICLTLTFIVVNTTALFLCRHAARVPDHAAVHAHCKGRTADH